MSILENIPLFSTLNEKEKKALEMFCQIKRISKGDILFLEGDEAQAMYIVKKGSLEVFKEIDGRKKILGKIEDGGFVGEMAIMQETPKNRMASVVALEDSELITILNFSIKELEKTHPEIIEKIKKIIEKRKQENKNKGL